MVNLKSAHLYIKKKQTLIKHFKNIVLSNNKNEGYSTLQHYGK